MLLKNLSKRERYIALATLSFLALAIVYNFILEPAVSRWRGLDDEMRSRLAVLKKDATIAANYTPIAAEYEKTVKQIKTGKSVEEETTDVLTQIETVSRSNSCLIVNIKPVGTKNLGSHRELLVEIAAEADIDRFSKFLYDIESSKGMMLKVRRATLSAKTGQPGTLRGNFIIGKILL